jgi:hypothetical protein
MAASRPGSWHRDSCNRAAVGNCMRERAFVVERQLTCCMMEDRPLQSRTKRNDVVAIEPLPFTRAVPQISGSLAYPGTKMSFHHAWCLLCVIGCKHEPLGRQLVKDGCPPLLVSALCLGRYSVPLVVLCVYRNRFLHTGWAGSGPFGRTQATSHGCN